MRSWPSAVPVFFGASTAAYVNGPLVGMLVIAFMVLTPVLIPGIPNMIFFKHNSL